MLGNHLNAKYSLDDVCEIRSCKHQFCRDCTRGHVLSEMRSNHFPIACPLCKIEGLLYFYFSYFFYFCSLIYLFIYLFSG